MRRCSVQSVNVLSRSASGSGTLQIIAIWLPALAVAIFFQHLSCLYLPELQKSIAAFLL
jgi:hypothetical protein